MIDDKAAEIIRQNVIKIMDEKNIKRAELARRMDCDQSHITSLLKSNKKPGRTGFGKETIKKLCLALEIDRKDLFEGYSFNMDGLVEFAVTSPYIEIISETKEEDIRTKLLKLVNNVLRNGTQDQIDVLCSIAETINMDIIEQKKASPMINALISEGRKVA